MRWGLANRHEWLLCLVLMIIPFFDFLKMTKEAGNEIVELPNPDSELENPDIIELTKAGIEELANPDVEEADKVDSDSDGECVTLASLAKAAKAEKLKQEASKLGAKPLTDLFNETEQFTAAEMEERAKKAIEARRLAEEKRAEERKLREEEKRKREEEKLQKQQELDRLKAEKEEARRQALEKKAEEKRLKEEERLKKEEERIKKEEEKSHKQKHLEFQKIEKDEARKLWEEKRLEERKKRDEQKEEERKKKEQERVQKEEERLQKMKETEKQRQEREEAKRLAEEEKKRAEEREKLKQEKQKQFFGNFFKSPGGTASTNSTRRSSLGEVLNSTVTEGSVDADVVELLPNGQPKPDEIKNQRRCIGPFVEFEPLPGMVLMPHQRRPPINVEEFDAACANQDYSVSIKEVFDRSRKRVTKRTLHLVKSYSEFVGDAHVQSARKWRARKRQAGLRVTMKKDGSFTGYLREIMDKSEDDTTVKNEVVEMILDTSTKSGETKESQNEELEEKKKDEEVVDGSENACQVVEVSKDNEITVVEDSVMEIEEVSACNTENKKVDQEEDQYELQRLYFKDTKQLDVFLLQPTNYGSRKFVMKGKYIRIRHDGEDKSWMDYFGSWRKLPGDCPLPRRPLTKLEKFFDYNEEDDFYSDVEDAGESVDESGDDVGSQSENEYDYEEDEGFLVPHGYLSEEEGGEGESADTENLKRQTKEWEARFKKKCVKMVPRLVGPFYGVDNEENKPAELLQFSAVFLCDTSRPIQVFSTDDEQCRANRDKLGRKKTMAEGDNIVTVIPKAAMPNLIRLVHGNTKGLKLLVEEFRAFWMKETETLENPQGDNLSKKKLEIKILSMAEREKREKLFPKVCWYVSKEVLRQYRLSSLPVPNPSCVPVPPSSSAKESNEDAKGSDVTVEPPSKRAKLAAN